MICGRVLSCLTYHNMNKDQERNATAASLPVLLIPRSSFVILTQEVIKAINWGTAPALL